MKIVSKSRIDPYSDTFNWFTDQLDFCLDVARQQNDGKLDTVDTAMLRGRIEFIKDFLQTINQFKRNPKPE